MKYFIFTIIIAIVSILNQEQVAAQAAEPKDKNTDTQNLTKTSFTNIFRQRIADIRKVYRQEQNKTIAKILNLDKKNEEILSNLSKAFLKQTKESIKPKVEALNEKVQFLLDDLKENHKAIINLTEIFIFTQVDKYMEQIDIIKKQIQNILQYVQPPHSICNNYLECEFCIKANNQNCIWCQDIQQCVVGNEFDGPFFKECDFFMANQCNANSQKIDGEQQLKVPKTRIKQIFKAEDSRIYKQQRQFEIEKQQELINLKNFIESYRFGIQRLQFLWNKLRQQEIYRQHLENYEYFLQKKDGEESAEGYIQNIQFPSDEELEELGIIVENDQDRKNKKNKNSKNPFASSSDNGSGTESKAQIQKEKELEEKKEKEDKIDSLISTEKEQEKEEKKENTQLDRATERTLEENKSPKDVQIDLDNIDSQEQEILQYVSEEMEREEKLKKQQKKSK